jgi:transposase-like protein
VAEQRYKAVLAVIGEVRTVADVALQWRVDRRTVHRWLARYEAGGHEGLGDRSHKPVTCPHQMPAAVAALVLELRRTQARPATCWSATSCSSSGWGTNCSRRWLGPARARCGRIALAARPRGHGWAQTATHQPEVSRDRSAVPYIGYSKSNMAQGFLLQSHGFELVRQWLR